MLVTGLAVKIEKEKAMKTITFMKRLALLVGLALIITSIPSFVMADSVGGVMTEMIDCLRQGDIEEAQEYNQMLPEYASEDCVNNMPKAMKAEYKTIVQSWVDKKEDGQYGFYDYWLTDVDNDGTAELLVAFWPSHAGAQIILYKYENGSLKNYGFIGNEEFCSAYPGHNGIVLTHSWQGYDTFSLVTLDNGKVKKEQLTYNYAGSWENYFNMRNRLVSHSEWIDGRRIPDYEVLEDEAPFSLSGKRFEHNLDYYAKNLSTSTFSNDLCSLMAAIVNCSGNSASIEKMFKTLKFKKNNYETYNYDDTSFFVDARDGITYSIGKRITPDGMNIILVDIRGTGNTSDIVHDITVSNIGDNNYSVHEGFRTAAEVIEEDLEFFLGGEPEYDEHTKYFIAGHSLGAAAGNILAADLSVMVGKDSVYNYNFACPNTVTSTVSIIDNPKAFNPSNSHSNIFNICRSTDRVVSLPGLESSMLLEAKEYGQYGWDIFQCFHTKHDYYWGKWGITKWFNDGIWFFWEAHDMGKYLDYVSGTNPKYSSTPTYGDNFTSIMNNLFIFCPVDAELVDSRGSVIAAVIDDEPYYYSGSAGEIYISTLGDKKCISYPKDKNYKLRLKGTDSGAMDYVVAQGSTDDELYSRNIIFENVSLTDGKRMRGIIDNEKIPDSRLYRENSDGKVNKDISINGTESDHIHDWAESSTIDVPATCSRNGSKSIHCKKCDDIKDGSVESIPMVPHTFGAWATTKAPTEKALGVSARTCTVCGATETTAIAQLAPTLKGVKISKPKAAKKSATIKWKKPSKKNLKSIKRIEIQYSMDCNFRSGVKTTTVNAKKTSKKIKLPKGKKYYVRIRAINGDHVSAWSAVKSVKAK